MLLLLRQAVHQVRLIIDAHRCLGCHLSADCEPRLRRSAAHSVPAATQQPAADGAGWLLRHCRIATKQGNVTLLMQAVSHRARLLQCNGQRVMVAGLSFNTAELKPGKETQYLLAQALLRKAWLLPRNSQRLTVLDGCSGVLKPGRLTLLLGPPASGKTTLLKAMAGKLSSGGALEVRKPRRNSSLVCDQYDTGL